MLERQTILEIISGNKTGILASLARSLLLAVTPLYRFAVAWRNRSFDRGFKRIAQVSVPVISIGNLTTGGTGKTPLVAFVAKQCLDMGFQPTILSRGYRGNANGKNDEALELEQRLPNVKHLQHPDRVLIARQAIDEDQADVLIMDDGFQHRYLHRDLDIVLIDSTCPFGYGHLLPRGLLREPISSLTRADIVVLSRTELVTLAQRQALKQQIARFVATDRVFEATTSPSGWQNRSGQEFALEHLQGQRVFAFCAIGNPDAFWKTAGRLDLQLAGHQTFPDHHNFTPDDLETLKRQAHESSAEVFICTHKDLVKLASDSIGNFPVYALQIDIKLANDPQDFAGLIEPLLQGQAGEIKQ